MRTLLLTLTALLLPLQASAGDLSGFMPETVGKMQRIELLTGDKAQDEVDKLHGKPLPAEASAVARYAIPKTKGVPPKSGCPASLPKKRLVARPARWCT